MNWRCLHRDNLCDSRYHGADDRLLVMLSMTGWSPATAFEAAFPNLMRADSPSERIGALVAGGFGKIRHTRPMLSLNNGFSDEDITDFVAHSPVSVSR